MKNGAAYNREKKKMTPLAIGGIGFICALLSLAAVVAVRHIKASYSPSLEASERLLARGKPHEAKAQLDKVRKTNRGGEANVRELMHRGRVLYAVMMEEMREEKWARYGINPDNWLSHPLADEAEKCFLDAMRIAPNDPEIRLTLGNLYREQGRFAESEDALRAALDIDPESADAYLALGLLYAEGRRLPVAEKALAQAWNLDKGNPRIAKNIGYYYRFYADDPESAVIWFGRYMATDPRRDADINLVRAELRNLIERYPEFEKHYKEEESLANRGAGRTFTVRKR